MNTRWHGISRRRGMVLAGTVAALLTSGGVAAAAASGDHGTAKHDGVTITKVSGNPHPHHIRPATPTKVRDLKTGEGTDEQTTLTEVPGVDLPDDAVPLEEPTPLPDTPVAIGDEGATTELPPTQ
ncbi:hypothetical protein ACIPSA_11705 [Streptomyces sp. NPDC086549]|uniref:hypothetical protein n=1 Tax=Streptomyces sp. NPDC086549 TaxID=3365752 RepID=UPI0038003CEA